jgi:hypothetical protein
MSHVGQMALGQRTSQDRNLLSPNSCFYLWPTYTVRLAPSTTRVLDIDGREVRYEIKGDTRARLVNAIKRGRATGPPAPRWR